MFLWASTATKREKLRAAEATLLSYAASFAPDNGDYTYEIETLDTPIPRSCLEGTESQAPSTFFDWCGVRTTLEEAVVVDKDVKGLDESCETVTTEPCTSSSSSSSSSSTDSVDNNLTGPLPPSTPTPSTSSLPTDMDNDPHTLVMHSIHVKSRSRSRSNQTRYDNANANGSDVPLVFLHGYMNAAAYFYRNLVGLSRFYRNVYSVDLLGWGLSSRPPFPEGSCVASAESFFVESLEAWRAYHRIDRMVLAGHSLGGYLSVAYCEKYPHRVHKLILLSPVGVPDEEHPSQVERRERLQSTWAKRTVFGIAQSLFTMSTIGGYFRTLPSSQAHNAVLNYVTQRLPEVADPNERLALADYLYFNNILPGSGEHAILRLLAPTVVAHQPLQHRVPELFRRHQIRSVHFFYGTTDWMDVSAAISTAQACDPTKDDISVHICRNAGHLLMLQNPHEFNVGVMAAGMDDSENEAALHLAPKLQRPELHWPVR